MHKLSSQSLKLLIIKFAGTFGSGMLSFAVNLYILQKTGSALGMGIGLITGPLVVLLATPIVGFIVDTKSHKTIMVCAQIATTVSLLLFGLIFHLWPGSYFLELIGLIVALQITDTFLSTTLTASLVQLFDGEELNQVNSLNQSMSSLASFLAPIIGAIVYTLVAIDTFAYVEVLFELTALLAIVFLHFNHVATPAASPSDTPEKQTVFQNFTEGLRYLVHQRLMFILSISSALINFFFAALNVGLPFLLVQTLKLSNAQYGMAESAFAVGMFLGGILLSQIHIKAHPVNFCYFFIIWLALILTITGVPTLTNWSTTIDTDFFLVLNALNGLLLVLINAPLNSFMQQIIPQQMQGRIFSLNATMSVILMPLGTLFFGLLFDHTAALPIFAVTGLILVALTVAMLLFIRKMKLLERPENIIDSGLQPK